MTHETHYRWVELVGTNHNRRDVNEEANERPCVLCEFYIELTGSLGNDWGVCSNADSPFDARLMFEHDGCEYFRRAALDEVDE